MPNLYNFFSPSKAVPLSLGAGAALYPWDESEAARFGVKRWLPFWHGIRNAQPGDVENVLKKGLIKGQSAELKQPGSSISEDPWVSYRLFSGEGQHRPNEGDIVAVKPLIPPSQAVNLYPAEYLTGMIPEGEAIYGKSNLFYREAEWFAKRKVPTAEELRNEYDKLMVRRQPFVNRISTLEAERSKLEAEAIEAENVWRKTERDLAQKQEAGLISINDYLNATLPLRQQSYDKAMAVSKADRKLMEVEARLASFPNTKRYNELASYQQTYPNAEELRKQYPIMEERQRKLAAEYAEWGNKLNNQMRVLRQQHMTPAEIENDPMVKYYVQNYLRLDRELLPIDEFIEKNRIRLKEEENTRKTLANVQNLVKPIPMTPEHERWLKRTIEHEDRYEKAAKDIGIYAKDYSGKPPVESKAGLKDYVSALSSLRGNPGLLEEMLGERLLSGDKGGAETMADLKKMLERHYQPDVAKQLVWDAAKLKQQRYAVTGYAFGQKKQDLYNRMQNPETRQAAIDEVSNAYQQYFRMRDKWLDDLENTVGAMPADPKALASKRHLPAVAAFPLLGQYEGRTGEAKPVGGVQQFFQTNPVGQFMTGLARSGAETSKEIMNNLNAMAFLYNINPALAPTAKLPTYQGQPGTQALNYLTAQGYIPPPTGSGYETLGSLFSPY